MSNLVKEYIRMTNKKRIANYKKSGKMSIYQDVLLVNFTKSIQERQKRLNRKRLKTVSEISKTEMVKRMKKIDEETEECKIEDKKIKKPLPLKKSEQEVEEISVSSMAEVESEDVWEDAREDFEDPAEEKTHSPFYNIFMSVASFFHF